METKQRLSKKFASEPGSYDLAIRISEPILNPGDRLQVEVYISGYGIIEAPKVACYPSPEVFDFDRSTVTHSAKKFDDGLSGFGAETVKLDPIGFVGTLSGGFGDSPNDASWFIDAEPGDSYLISTEVRHPQGTSPLYLDFTIKRDARPGPQSIQFVFTYFNGQTWNTSSKRANFTVRNFYQRHETFVWLLGGFAAIVTILLSIESLYPILKNYRHITVTVLILVIGISIKQWLLAILIGALSLFMKVLRKTISNYKRILHRKQ